MRAGIWDAFLRDVNTTLCDVNMTTAAPDFRE
jgi:hypothetical protein